MSTSETVWLPGGNTIRRWNLNARELEIRDRVEAAAELELAKAWAWISGSPLVVYVLGPEAGA